MTEQPPQDFILGIDLGSNSLGWALIERANGEPTGLLRADVRIFEAATEGDRESGQEESRNRARHEARLYRRQRWQKIVAPHGAGPRGLNLTERKPLTKILGNRF
jgi:CRISPR/Cas system Type II protein with McrA/HNH and RuvC-like nuclease domain